MNSRVALAWIGISALAGALILLAFPPDLYPLYPLCPVYSLTGIHCPGCGMTRAFSCLLQGRLRDATAMNFFSLPLAFSSAAWYVWQFRIVLMKASQR